MNASLHPRDDPGSAAERTQEAMAWVSRALAGEVWLQTLRTRRAEEDRPDGRFLSPRAAA
jgi:hypothetical protein